MVEPSKNAPKSHQTITKIWAMSNSMEVSDAGTNKLEKELTRMPGRHYDNNCKDAVNLLFEIAAAKMSDDKDKEVLANLAKHVAAAQANLYNPKPRYMDAFFFPNKQNVTKLANYIGRAKKTLEICVFNITNDDLANAVMARHRAGVKVRVITDDETMTNKGNDCQKLADNGLAVRSDSEPSYHMHNKFAIVDNEFIITGSFNWTFQAGSHNQENLCVIDHPYYITKYAEEFNKLWASFAHQQVEGATKQMNDAAIKIQRSYRAKPKPSGVTKKNNDYKFTGW